MAFFEKMGKINVFWTTTLFKFTVKEKVKLRFN